MPKRLSVFLLIALMVIPLAASRVAAQQMDILGTASGNANYSTFVRLVQVAGLDDELRGTGPFTVFAPTNSAFAMIPQDTLDSLMRTENREQLRTILLYHVVQGRYLSSDLVRGVSPCGISTLMGSVVPVTHGRAGVTVGRALVVQPNVTASNGIIHGIDRVLIPPGMMGTPRR